MTTHEYTKPLVLIIAGHDPSGAAGIHADIETMFACGVRCASLLTATTTQDTARFASLQPQRLEDFSAQAELLLADMRFSACKIGLLGNSDIAECVISLIPRLGGIPIVLDPILRTGTGAGVADSTLFEAIRDRLLPICTVVTPNMAEIRILSGCETGAEAAQKLLALGAKNILTTGADEDTPSVVNTLYQCHGTQTEYEYRRLAGIYHGSGCTLSASLAAYLARGFNIEQAARRAQEFTWSALAAGGQIGRGQLHPDRMQAVDLESGGK
jgi:hydroxymethylpyrimidine/phosphomethylpyrimidine kinase